MFPSENASMRPRHKAAENLTIVGRSMPVMAASMRPRHKAAENPGDTLDSSPCPESFNEAAA